MWLDVNGEKRQRGNTKTMIFDCRHIVWACSQYFVMEPGDVIITGTPPGVGLGMKPEPKFLKGRRCGHARHRRPRRAAAEGGEVQDVMFVTPGTPGAAYLSAKIPIDPALRGTRFSIIAWLNGGRPYLHG